MFNVGVIQAILRLKDEMSKGLIKAQKNLQKTAKSMRSIGTSMTKFVTLPLLAIGAGAVKAFADFDQAMTNSIAIMGDVSDAMRNEMAAEAKRMATITTFSATEAAEAYFFLASAGLSAEQAVAALSQTAAFAQAGNFDMAEATDLLTDAQSALGLTVDDTAQNMQNMARVSDVLVKANTLANATVQQFSTSLTREAGASMKAFNIDVEEGVAVLAAFADQGVKGELAGSGLSRILKIMTSAAIKSKDAYQKFGVEVFDASGNINNMADIIGQLEGALGDMSDETRTAALEQLGFSARLQGVILPLLGTSEKIRQYEKDLRSAGGVTQEIADNQLKSFSAQMKLLKNQFVNAGISLGEVLAPALVALRNGLSKAMAWFNRLSPAMKKWVVIIAAAAAAAGPLLIALSAVVGALLGPVGLIAAAVALVLALKPVRKWIAEKIPQAVPILVGALKSVHAAFQMVQLGLTAGMKAWTLMMARAEVKLANQAAALDQNAETVGRAIDAAFALEAAENAVRNAAEITAAEIENFNTALDEMVDAATGGGGGAKKALDEVAVAIGNLPASIDPWAVSQEAANLTTMETLTAARLVDNALRQLAVTYGTSTSASAQWEFALEGLNDAYGNTLSLQNQLGNSAKKLGGIMGAVSGVFGNLWGSIKSVVSGITGGNGLAGLFENLGKGIIDGFGQILSGGLAGLANVAVQMIVSWVSDIMKKANVADHVAEFFGRDLSQGLLDAMEAARSQTGGDIAAAFRLLISDAIEEATIDSLADLQSWITQVHQVLSSVDEGTLSAEQAIKSMGAAWLALVPAMEQLGGNAMDLQRQFSDMISRFGATPEVIAQITAAILAMEAAGVAGVGELVDWLATLGVTIEGVMTSAERAQEAFEDWQDAVAIVEDLKAELEAVRAGADKLSQMAAQVTDAFADMGVGGIASAQSIRDKWKAMAQSGALSWADAQRFMRAELASTKAAALAAFKAQAAAAGFSAEDQDRVANELYAAWRANVRATEIEARRAVRQQAIDARKELRQEIIDARHAARQKFLLFKKLARQVAGPGGTFESIASAWTATIDGMIKDGQRFFDVMAGNSVFPDVATAAIEAADAVGAQWDGTFSDITVSGSQFGAVATSALPAASAPPAPFSGPSNAGMEDRLGRIELLLREQPDAIGNAVQHGQQTNV